MTINRRRALTVVASVPAAVVFGGSAFAAGEPGELAAFVKRYFEEIDVFNATDHKTDKESNKHAKATYEKTMTEMVGVPARTRDDALAALDWLVKDEADLGDVGQSDWNPYARLVGSLVDAIRGYIEGRVA